MSRVMRESKYRATCGTPLRLDNRSAIEWTTAEQPSSTHTKHIDVSFHIIRIHARNRTTAVKYVPTEHNDADIITKPIGRLVLCESN